MLYRWCGVNCLSLIINTKKICFSVTNQYRNVRETYFIFAQLFAPFTILINHDKVKINIPKRIVSPLINSWEYYVMLKNI